MGMAGQVIDLKNNSVGTRIVVNLRLTDWRIRHPDAGNWAAATDGVRCSGRGGPAAPMAADRLAEQPGATLGATLGATPGGEGWACIGQQRQARAGPWIAARCRDSARLPRSGTDTSLQSFELGNHNCASCPPRTWHRIVVRSGLRSRPASRSQRDPRTMRPDNSVRRGRRRQRSACSKSATRSSASSSPQDTRTSPGVMPRAAFWSSGRR